MIKYTDKARIEICIIRPSDRMTEMIITSKNILPTIMAKIIIPNDIQILTYISHTKAYVHFHDVKFPDSLNTITIIGKHRACKTNIYNLVLPEHLIKLELDNVSFPHGQDISCHTHLCTLNCKHMKPFKKMPPSLKSYHLELCKADDLDNLPLGLEELHISYLLSHAPTNLPPSLKRIILSDHLYREETAAMLTKLPFGCEIIYA